MAVDDEQLSNVFRESEPEPSLLSNREALSRVQHRVLGKRHRRNTVITGVLSSVLTLVVVSAGWSMGVGDRSSRYIAGPTTTQMPMSRDETIHLSAHHEQLKPEAETPQDVKRNGTIIAASTAGRLVAIDPSTGKTKSVLTVMSNGDAIPVGALIGNVSYSEHTKSVYFDAYESVEGMSPRPSLKCHAGIYRIPLSGGQPIRLLSGTVPSVSPDGKRLAYVRVESESPNGGSCIPTAVVVRDLDTSQEVVEVKNASDQQYRAGDIVSISWSANGSALAIDVRPMSGDPRYIAVVDLQGGQELQSLSRVDAPKNTPKGTTWTYPRYLADGRMFVSEVCCEAGTTSRPSSRMIVIDPKRTDSQTLVAIGFADRSHTSTTVSPDGQHLAYLSGQDLMVSDQFARPTSISHGFIGVTWVR